MEARLENARPGTEGVKLEEGFGTSRSLLGLLRDTGAMPWLGRRMTYTIGAPVLTLAGAGAVVAVPLLIGPARFGDYILLLSIFQYACAFDLGLSQLADKALATRGGGHTASVAELVWARLAVAIGSLLLAFLLSFALARPEGEFTVGNLLTAAAGGVAFMLSNGSLALYRAGSRIWEFTFCALTMHVGLSVPRLAGLVLGGVTGSYAALAAFYALTATMLNEPFTGALRRRPSVRKLTQTFGAALPLFAFSSLWLLYLTANRWISSALSDAEEFGFFALGANLVAAGVGVLSTVGQVHYPKHRTGAGGADAEARLGRELLHLLGVATAGTLAGVVACRYAIPLVFPKFVAAAEPSAALMISGVPLSLASWLIPLVIASSRRPWTDATAVFVLSAATLGGAMAAGDTLGSVVGQAWGCTATSPVPVVVLLALLVRASLLSLATAARVLGVTVASMSVNTLAWVCLDGWL
jgi:O-antigen/teichoic acid export membrane protein